MKKLIALIISVCLLMHAAACIADSDVVYIGGRSPIQESKYPDNLTLINILIVDIDQEALNSENEITADIYNVYVPPDEELYTILLFDGWHGVPGWHEWIASDIVRIKFRPEDLRQLDTVYGLYLIIIGQLV